MRSRQDALGNEALGSGVLYQKRILAVGLVREPAAAGLLPCELFVEELHLESGGGQLLRGERARGTAA